MANEPTWYRAAAQQLAAGKTIVDTAESLGISEKTLRRHRDAPAGTLRGLVDAAKAAQAEGVADELAPLRAKALAVLGKALDDGDLSAAKTVMGKLVASPETAPAEERPVEAEITPDDAARELALAFPAIADLAREGRLSPDSIAQLRAAARAFLADDLQPRPPLDLEADRVDSSLVSEPSSDFRAAADEGGAAIIPIRPA